MFQFLITHEENVPEVQQWNYEWLTFWILELSSQGHRLCPELLGGGSGVSLCTIILEEQSYQTRNFQAAKQLPKFSFLGQLIFCTWTYFGFHSTLCRYIAPTLLLDVPLDAPIMNEEIFGPILPIITVGFYALLTASISMLTRWKKWQNNFPLPTLESTSIIRHQSSWSMSNCGCLNKKILTICWFDWLLLGWLVGVGEGTRRSHWYDCWPAKATGHLCFYQW